MAEWEKRVIKPEVYLEPSLISTVEVFCENSEQFLGVNYLRKKAPLQMFDRILNTPLKTILPLLRQFQNYRNFISHNETIAELINR